MQQDCPSPELLAAFRHHTLSREEQRVIEHHFAECQSCRETLLEVIRLEKALPLDNPDDEPHL